MKRTKTDGATVPVAGPSSAPLQSTRQALPRQAKNGHTHAERQTKLANVVASKKRHEVKAKAQTTAKGKGKETTIPGPSKCSVMLVIKVEELEEDEESVEGMIEMDTSLHPSLLSRLPRLGPLRRRRLSTGRRRWRLQRSRRRSRL